CAPEPSMLNIAQAPAAADWSRLKGRLMPPFFLELVMPFVSFRLLSSLTVISTSCLTGAYLLSNHYAPWVTAYQDFLAFLAVTILLLFLSSYATKVYIP